MLCWSSIPIFWQSKHVDKSVSQSRSRGTLDVLREEWQGLNKHIDTENVRTIRRGGSHLLA